MPHEDMQELKGHVGWMVKHAKPFALHYWIDASPFSDGFAIFFCCESSCVELHWRQPIIKEGGEEFKISLLELWKWDCFLLSEIWIHLRASAGLRNHFPSQTSSAGCTWMSHNGAICVKVICFDGRCPWLTISSISLLPNFSPPWRSWQGVFSVVLLSWAFAVSDSDFFCCFSVSLFPT